VTARKDEGGGAGAVRECSGYVHCGFRVAVFLATPKQ